MVKIVKRAAIIILILLVVFGAFLWCGKNMIPGGGEQVFESRSDNGEYELVIYYVPHSLSDDMIRGEIEYGDGEVRKIYWAPSDSDGKADIEAEWIDEKTVRINGVVLDIFKDKYDYRK